MWPVPLPLCRLTRIRCPTSLVAFHKTYIPICLSGQAGLYAHPVAGLELHACWSVATAQKQWTAQLDQPLGKDSAWNSLFLFLLRHGIFLEVFTADYRCSLHPISALSNLVKISLKVQKLSRKGGGEQMDERGVDRQHDLIIPTGIGIQARIEIF